MRELECKSRQISCTVDRILGASILLTDYEQEDVVSALMSRMYFGTVCGREVRGFKKAYEVYYGKPFKTDLDYEELVTLMAAAKSPQAFSSGSSEHSQQLRESVFQKLKAANAIPQIMTADGCRGESIEAYSFKPVCN